MTLQPGQVWRFSTSRAHDPSYVYLIVEVHDDGHTTMLDLENLKLYSSLAIHSTLLGHAYYDHFTWELVT